MKFLRAIEVDGAFTYLYEDQGEISPGPKPSREILQQHSMKTDKKDSDKPRMDLLRPEFVLGIGKVLAYGASKYNESRGDLPNYLKDDGFHYSRLIASAQRHLAQFQMGTDIDEETGESHLLHCAANLMMLHTYTLTTKGKDDRVLLDDLEDD